MAEVNQQSAAVQRMAKHWPMIDALMDGTDAMRAAGEKFLPKWPNEDGASYKARLGTAVLHPVFSRTVKIMAAKPLSKAMTFNEAIPKRILEWLSDVDLAGTSIHAFASQVMIRCLSHGIHGVLVDYPKVDGVKTKADEDRVGARPYFTIYQASSILGWQTEKAAEGVRLIQLRLLEQVTEPDGAFGEVTFEQVRVLTPGAWAIWRKESGKDEWKLHSEGTTTLQEIPFVFFYGLREGFGIGSPPLLDLAYQNVEHWQSRSDQQTILHVARVPILFAKGFGETPITIGAGTAAASDNADSDLKYVEHTGASIKAGRDEILDLEERMRQTGAELLVPRPTATTATAVVSDGEANKSTLQQIVEVFEESLNACIDLMGDWVGEEIEDAVELYKDFGAAHLADKSLTDLHQMASDGLISGETLFEELKRRDVLDPDLTWEEESKRQEIDRKRRTDDSKRTTEPA